MGWGELGINVAAHATGQTPLPLRIKDKKYSKGLGHHAPGEIVIALDGRFSRFEAEVGVEWQRGASGSVVFQVFVDAAMRFDSGIMRERDAARAINIDVTGADELRLVLGDAGDGITCDAGNWADARLIANPTSPSKEEPLHLDIAPFARLVTSDPERKDGARAGRIEEFHQEDLDLDRSIDARALLGDGLGPWPDGRRSVGLVWLERRRIGTLRLALGERSERIEEVAVEFWDGPTLWQGAWKPLTGSWNARAGANSAVESEFRPNDKADAAFQSGTRKVRFIFPSGSAAPHIARIQAISRSAWTNGEVVVEIDPSHNDLLAASSGRVEIYNGLIATDGDAPISKASATSVAWPRLSEPLKIRVLYCRSRRAKADRTVLRISMNGEMYSVGVDDVLDHECVDLREAGIVVRRADRPFELADYRRRTASEKTILSRVREMPDQTFAQALAKTHHAAQDQGPTMLSLAADNQKFVVGLEGNVEWGESIVPGPLQHELKVRFGDAPAKGSTRHLEGGWLPIPIIEVRDGSILYRETAAVAPRKTSDGKPRPLGFLEFTLENSATETAAASIGLAWSARSTKDAAGNAPVELRLVSQDTVVSSGGRAIAFVQPEPASGLYLATEGQALKIAGEIAPGKQARFRVYLPAWDLPADEVAGLGTTEDLFALTAEYWKQELAKGTQIEVPDQLLANAIRASQVHCLMAARSEADGTRIAPWIASMSYGPLESESNSIIRGMDLLGHADFARRGLEYYIHRYDPNGRLTTGYTLMGAGWHLQTLAEHFDLKHDEAWLRSFAPRILTACQWIEAQRKKTATLFGDDGGPEAGLMPPGVMADWNNYAYYFCLNGYNCAGLGGASRAMAGLGIPGAEPLANNADEFRRALRAGYEWTRARSPVVALRDGSWVRPYPSQLHVLGPTGDAFPGEDANRSWCYDIELGAHQLVPQGVLSPTDPSDARSIRDMMEHMEDRQFLADGWFDYPASENEKDWFNLGGFSKVQPYYTRNAEIYAMTDEVKPFVRSYFNTLAAMLNTENLSLWEHFHASGAWNKTHETGYFLQQTRFMLVMERGDELWLAPMVTNQWLKDGDRISVKGAPTRFGMVGFEIQSHVASGFIEATVEPPTRLKPNAIHLRLRPPDGRRLRRAATIGGDGGSVLQIDPTRDIVTLPLGIEKITRLRAEFE